MTAIITRFADLPPTSWKNGLGKTTQLASHPASATAESFEWRVSVASVIGSAPFSIFPGVNRCLVVLEGEMVLAFDGGEPIKLDAHSAPAEFSGDIACEAYVATGQVMDLNLMYHRAAWRGHMHRVARRPGDRLVLSPSQMLFVLSDGSVIRAAGKEWNLSKFDLVRCSEVSVHEGPIDGYLIDVGECAASGSAKSS